MTAIALKDIPNCLIEKIIKPLTGENKNDEEVMRLDYFNQAITLQGEVRLTLSREKLAKIIYEKVHTEWGIGPKWEEADLEKREYYFLISDAILADLKDLIEVVK